MMAINYISDIMNYQMRKLFAMLLWNSKGDLMGEYKNRIVEYHTIENRGNSV